MPQTHISRTVAVAGVLAALLWTLIAAGDALATGSCDRLRDGQHFIDWARARSNQNHPPDPDRRPQPLRTLLNVIDRPAEGQSFIDWARARGTHAGQTPSPRLSPPTRALDSLLGVTARDGE